MSGTIIVPLDGSELAEQALPYAEVLARRLGAEIRLVSAVDVGPVGDGESASLEAGEARAELLQVAARLKALGLDISWEVIQDEPARGILDAAQRSGDAAIVMSTHGRSGLGRWVYGSVADEVLRYSEIPVLLVSPTMTFNWPADPNEFRIVVPVDGSALADRALSPAERLVQATGGELYLVRAVEPLSAAAVEAAGAYLPEDALERTEAARRELNGLQSELAGRGIRATAQVEVGKPREVILDTVHECHAHLIVMATHGRGGVSRAVLGSVADDVLRHARVPLLLVHPDAEVSQRVLDDRATQAVERPTAAILMNEAEQNATLRALEQFVAQPAGDEQHLAVARALLRRLVEARHSSVDRPPDAAT